MILPRNSLTFPLKQNATRVFRFSTEARFYCKRPSSSKSSLMENIFC